ncbi:hypothetical protein AB4090_14630 [Acidithiobacillus sp. IBUN Pt1247-S3]|uniref:hypothetical protein n=1 Tax=Acidithiobacillus sp. IBUN Pt1247-S3 TaxID=3166642 RepID=UPI0034E38513
MTDLFAAQRQLLQQQIAVLQRLGAALQYTSDRLPWPLETRHLHDPETAERLAALNDRFTKLQDQLVGAMRHADLFPMPS